MSSLSHYQLTGYIEIKILICQIKSELLQLSRCYLFAALIGTTFRFVVWFPK